MIGHTLELVFARVVERQAAAGNKVLHRLRNEDLRSARVAHHPGADGYRDARVLAVDVDEAAEAVWVYLGKPIAPAAN